MRRAPVRFGLLAGAVGLLVFLVLFQQTLLSTLVSFFSGALGSQSGAVVVYSDDARKNPEGSVLSLATVEQVATVEGVARAEPLGIETTTARAGGAELDVVIFGYVLGGPGAPRDLVEGRLPRASDEGVASDIDEDRGFGLGDTVTVVGPDGSLPIRIVGRAPDLRFSVDPAVFVSYDTFARAAEVQNPDAQDIPPAMVVVEPEEGVEPAVLAGRITRDVDGVEALDRDSAVDSLPGVVAVSRSFTIVLTLAFVVIALVIGIFFVILTVQKTASLTLLRAIGAPGSILVRALLVQVALIVLAGIAIGAAMLWLASLGSSARFPISFEIGVVVTRGAAIAILALLASLAAVRRVLRLDPVAAVTPHGAGE
jgi:putative ABC transport system permease protein